MPVRKPKKSTRKVGRPRIVIKWDEFEKLCALQCTLIECAAWVGVSEDTIERRVKDHYKENFADVFKQKRVKGLVSLRRSQFKLAEKNATMSIFLGKNYLHQRDVQEFEAGVIKVVFMAASQDDGGNGKLINPKTKKITDGKPDIHK